MYYSRWCSDIFIDILIFVKRYLEFLDWGTVHVFFLYIEIFGDVNAVLYWNLEDGKMSFFFGGGGIPSPCNIKLVFTGAPYWWCHWVWAGGTMSLGGAGG